MEASAPLCQIMFVSRRTISLVLPIHGNYTLEQDEGMPHWECFKDLCHLRFGLAIRANRLAKLARLPFASMAQ